LQLRSLPCTFSRTVDVSCSSNKFARDHSLQCHRRLATPNVPCWGRLTGAQKCAISLLSCPLCSQSQPASLQELFVVVCLVVLDGAVPRPFSRRPLGTISDFTRDSQKHLAQKYFKKHARTRSSSDTLINTSHQAPPPTLYSRSPPLHPADQQRCLTASHTHTLTQGARAAHEQPVIK
jgi:hypothetical protein